MYHHYTVDEHLIRTVGMLTDIERGGASERAAAVDARSSAPSRTGALLYVAAFLHDIGKGRTEDHSIVGARIARELCPRLGLTPAETETVAWLIEQHLTMSNIAQSRDLSDPKTIRDFADMVQSPERLKLLLLLTVADIRAVGPGVWNGWKGQLLRTLYYETEPLVAGGHTQVKRSQRMAEAQETLRHDARRLDAATRSNATSTATTPTTGCAPTSSAASSTPSCCAAPRAKGCTSPPTRDRRVHCDHRADGFGAEPPAAAGAVRRRLCRGRRQHRRRPHHDDARRLCARHVPAQPRVQGRRGRAAARQAHRRDSSAGCCAATRGSTR